MEAVLSLLSTDYAHSAKQEPINEMKLLAQGCKSEILSEQRSSTSSAELSGTQQDKGLKFPGDETQTLLILRAA